MVFDMSMLSLLLVVDMVVDRCGRWPMLDVRGTAEGCRLEVEAEGSRMGKLVLLSAIVGSELSGGGTSPRLETRLSRARVMVDLERLWWLPLLLMGGESVVDWMEAYEGCLCRDGLGERRDVMGKCVFVARGRCHHTREGGVVIG
jgi:hypothetical protein